MLPPGFEKPSPIKETYSLHRLSSYQAFGYFHTGALGSSAVKRHYFYTSAHLEIIMKDVGLTEAMVRKDCPSKM